MIYRYTLYRNKRNSFKSKMLQTFRVEAKSPAEIAKSLYYCYGIKNQGGLKYDGRIGSTVIYKSKANKNGYFFLLHVTKQ